jgi:hypothetical protein
LTDQKGRDMTDEKKHDDKDRQKVSDEELEDVAGGATAFRTTRTIGPIKTKASPEICDGMDNNCETGKS